MMGFGSKGMVNDKELNLSININLSTMACTRVKQESSEVQIIPRSNFIKLLILFDD